MAEWLSSWLAEQEDRGSIPGLATWIFRDWLSPASKSRYGWKIAKSTLILKTTTTTTWKGTWCLFECSTLRLCWIKQTLKFIYSQIQKFPLHIALSTHSVSYLSTVPLSVRLLVCATSEHLGINLPYEIVHRRKDCFKHTYISMSVWRTLTHFTMYKIWGGISYIWTRNKLSEKKSRQQ